MATDLWPMGRSASNARDTQKAQVQIGKNGCRIGWFLVNGCMFWYLKKRIVSHQESPPYANLVNSQGGCLKTGYSVPSHGESWFSPWSLPYFGCKCLHVWTIDVILLVIVYPIISHYLPLQYIQFTYIIYHVYIYVPYIYIYICIHIGRFQSRMFLDTSRSPILTSRTAYTCHACACWMPWWQVPVRGEGLAGRFPKEITTMRRMVPPILLGMYLKIWRGFRVWPNELFMGLKGMQLATKWRETLKTLEIVGIVGITTAAQC